MNEVNWLVVVTAAILIVSGMLGYINGLIKTIINLVLGVVTLILVLTLSPYVGGFLQQKTSLQDHIQEKAQEIVWEQMQTYQQNNLAWEEDAVEQLVEDLPFLPTLKKELLAQDWIGQSVRQEAEQIASNIGEVISEKIVMMIAYVFTFLAVFITLRILAFLLDVIGHLPLIRGINKLTGLVAGLAEGLMVVWILGILLTVLGTSSLGQSAAACIEESSFLSIIYGYNLLQKILFWIIA